MSLKILKSIALFLILAAIFFIRPPLVFAIELSTLSPQDSPEEEDSHQPQPIIVNGDTVEYSTENKEFTATGNVLVIYRGTKLSCQKLSLNSETKDCQAEGDVRLEDSRGIIVGNRMVYNFEKQAGTMFDSGFRSNPYFGKQEKLIKVSDREFMTYRGYMSTCSYDHVHWKLKSRITDFFPGDKVELKDSIFYIGKIPLLYLPRYTRSLKDPIMQVQMMPGTSKAWGPYLLSAWRYSLTEDLKGRIYVDYRSSLGIAEGFGTNYDSHEFGNGDFKLYYTQERDKSKDVNQEDVNVPKVFERYFIRLRHKWTVDEQTNMMAEYYRIIDSKRALMGSSFNILKDYFPREYEKDQMPLSYITMHHSFAHSSVDLLFQPRVNRWYSQAEYLPQIIFNLPSMQLGSSRFYLENKLSYENFKSKQAVPSSHDNDITYNLYSMTNKLSYAFKLAFLNFTPFISESNSYSDNKKGTYRRTVELDLAAGTDMSTKFYRIFNLNTNFLGLNINGLRHIITPTVSYSYTKNSTMPASDFRFGGGATTGGGSPISLELDNKLQTKRLGGKVDIASFRVNTSYTVKPKTGEKRGSSFSDFLFNLELYPYSWLSFVGNATYTHSGPCDGDNYNHLSQVNFDLNFNFSPERKFGFGQRYNRKGSNEIIYQLDWRLNPKWKFRLYHRREQGHLPTLIRGLREQEYSFSRDLHCWTMDLTYNVTRSRGESVWVIFRLKAFPELEFDYNQEYNVPKPGSQSPGMPSN